MWQYWWMLPLGAALGVLGTLVGAGGGFLLVPLLLLIYPNESPETITSISLAVVCANAASGSVSYARMRRIDYRSGLLFAAASVPGAVLGALATGRIPRRVFDGVFGVALTAIAAFLVMRTLKGRRATRQGPGKAPAEDTATTRLGTYSLRKGLAISAVVGFLSSVLGVGGGIMHVPALVYALGFPVHVATATSHFVMAITAGVGTLVHILSGAFEHGVRRAIMLGVGALIGAPFGAALSRRVGEKWIVRALAAALALAGVRLVVLGAAGGP